MRGKQQQQRQFPSFLLFLTYPAPPPICTCSLATLAMVGDGQQQLQFLLPSLSSYPTTPRLQENVPSLKMVLICRSKYPHMGSFLKIRSVDIPIKTDTCCLHQLLINEKKKLCRTQGIIKTDYRKSAKGNRWMK